MAVRRHTRFDDGSGLVHRVDLGGLREAKTDAASGFLDVEAYFAIAGVYTYQNADGTTTRELIDTDELFDAESLATLPGRPVTNEHPRNLVTAKTAKDVQVGSVKDTPSPDGTALKGGMLLTVDTAIADVQAGKRQVSCGYTCRLDHTPGTHDTFGPYDAIQRERRYNHVAIVPRGRHGATASLRADADGAVMVRADDDSTPKALPAPQPPKSPMKTLIDLLVSLGHSRADAEQAVGDALSEAQAQAKADAATSARADLDALQSQIETLTAQRDMLQAKVDEAPDAPSDADLLSYAVDRAAILARAAEHKVTVDKADEIASLADLKTAVLRGIVPDLKADAAPAYIDAAWDMLPRLAEKGRSGFAIVTPTVVRDDDAPQSTPGDGWRKSHQQEVA